MIQKDIIFLSFSGLLYFFDVTSPDFPTTPMFHDSRWLMEMIEKGPVQ